MNKTIFTLILSFIFLGCGNSKSDCSQFKLLGNWTQLTGHPSNPKMLTFYPNCTTSEVAFYSYNLVPNEFNPDFYEITFTPALSKNPIYQNKVCRGGNNRGHLLLYCQPLDRSHYTDVEGYYNSSVSGPALTPKPEQ